MAKTEPVIKLTADLRYHAAGAVVDTLAEAFDRCDRKCKGWSNYFFTLDETSLSILEVCGTRSYIEQWVQSELEYRQRKMNNPKAKRFNIKLYIEAA